MKKNFKLISMLTLLLLVISIGVVGCQRPARLTPDNDNLDNDLNRDINDDNNLGDNNIGNNNNNNMNNGNNRNNNNDNNMNNGNNRNNNNDNNRVGTNFSERADRIEDRISDLQNVNDATVIISGNTAIVGVDLENDVEGKITNDLKDRIENIVRNADRDIENVTVTADADLFERIQGIGRDVRRGEPISGFGEEIEEIIRRITPKS